jgi:GAF domain-containing protein
VVEILTMVAHGDGGQALPAKLCAACLSALPVSGVGIALMTADGPSGVVLAATDERARLLEELQFALGEGPCVEASLDGRPVLEPDLVEVGSPRWPKFAEAATAAGVHAVFAFPLRVGAIRVGVLDLYRDTPGRLTGPDVAEALAFADAATEVVLHLQDHAMYDNEPAALIGSIDSRAVVHQATGMIAVQMAGSLAEALLRLRAHAYASGRAVSAVAADVVDRRLRFDNDQPDGGTGTRTQRDQRERP